MADQLVETIIEAEARRSKERAKKVEDFVALLRDPDLADFVAKLTNRQQSGPVPQAAPVIPTWKPSPSSLRGIIRELELPTRFTAREALSRIDGKYTFKKSDPLQAVRDAIYELSRPGEGQIFRVVETGGGGGKEQVYERVA